jgi:ParB/RepB/Spo0J family partition protein
MLNDTDTSTLEKQLAEILDSIETPFNEAAVILPANNSEEIQISDEITLIDINKIVPDQEQPRKFFDTESLNNLKGSIESTSLHNPILVRENFQKPGNYIIIDGQRRFQACSELNHEKIKCRIVTSDSQGYKILALTQNIHREDLLPIEKANAFAELLEKLRGSNEKVKQNALIEIVNLSKNSISEFLKISTLDDEIKQEALKSKEWSARKLLQLAKIKNNSSRADKFREFKAIINKKSPKNTSDTDNTANQSDDGSQTDKSSSRDFVSISQIQKKITGFQKFLKKIDQKSLASAEIEILKADLSDLVRTLESIYLSHKIEN